MAEETRNSLDGQAEVVVQAGHIGDLQLHHHLHGDGPRSRPAPFQLPPVLARFENRHAEQERIGAAVGRGTDHGGPLVVTLTGIAGIGKTALGLHVARRFSEHYPDGVLYVDLDDLRREGVAGVADAVGELLTGLGVAPAWIERSLGGRSKQYWTGRGTSASSSSSTTPGTAARSYRCCRHRRSAW